MVGAPEQTESGATTAGAAYVFSRNADGSWTEVKKLVASDNATKGHFGAAVAIAKDVILVGAPHESPSTTRAGAVYVFQLKPEGWVETQKIVAVETANGDLFGAAIAIDAGFVVIGAPGAANGGAVYGLTL